jgi:hypothetical protein
MASLAAVADPSTSAFMFDARQLPLLLKETYYCNRGFLNSGDLASRTHEHSALEPYSLMTLKKVADWMLVHGNKPIPAHGAGTYQLRALPPASYIDGLNGCSQSFADLPETEFSTFVDPVQERIHRHMADIMDHPGDIEFGTKAFHDEGENIVATPVQKAEAIYRYIQERIQAASLAH